MENVADPKAGKLTPFTNNVIEIITTAHTTEAIRALRLAYDVSCRSR